MKKITINNQYRELNIRSGNINEEDRTVEVSFSSEEPVERYVGTEILDHTPSSVDLTRLNNGAAVLEDHQGGQIGKVISATIENRRGIAKLMFSRVGKGAEVFQDIIDGIRENISFGYQLEDLTLEKEEKGENPIYRSFKWMPFEISVVGTPADTTIGIGRSKETEKEIEVDESFRDLSEPKEEIIEKLIVEKSTRPKNLREKELLLAEAKLRLNSIK